MTDCYFNDQWTLDDQLGIAGTGDLLARLVLQTTPPFSVRVNGKWGSGKTSVLRRAFATLGGKPMRQSMALGIGEEDTLREKWGEYHYVQREGELKWQQDNLNSKARNSISIWFSPWQHQGAANPLIALLLEIRNQFDAWMKFNEHADNANRRGGLAALALIERVVDAAATLAVQRGVNIAKGTTETVRKAWREAAPNLTELSDGQRFHLMFEDAVINALRCLPGIDNNNLESARLIVFIDDLDRCEEQVIVELLESTKLYLNSPHCVFVLGLDDAAVLNAISRSWPERNMDDNREYLEKMFQATVALPLPKPASIRETVAAMLKLHQVPLENECAVMIEQLIEPNPRKIKNFCNSLCAAWEQFQGSDSTRGIDSKIFVLFFYLRLFHSPIWRILERQPGALIVLYQILVGPASLPESTNLGNEEQTVLRAFFSREFLHVLRDNTKEPVEGEHIHCNLPMEQAVSLLQQRLDRKRSDEYFVRQFNELVGADKVLADQYLYLGRITQGEQVLSCQEAEAPIGETGQ